MSRRTIAEDGASANMDSNEKNSQFTRCSQASVMCCSSSLARMSCTNAKLKMFRHYMLIPWYVRSCLTMFLVSFLSLLQGSDELEHLDALTAKDSVLNQVFVKMGWAWTLCAMTGLTLSLLPLTGDPLRVMGRAGARALLLTGVFYWWCAMIFPGIEHHTGLCLSRNVVLSQPNKRACVKAGNTFYSFDISGHSFLMVFCCLTLMQEARVMRRYFSLGRAVEELDSGDGPASSVSGSMLNDATENKRHNTDAGSPDDGPQQPQALDTKTVSKTEALKFRWMYMLLWPVVCLCYVCVCVLCVTWDGVLIITTIYYHTLLEKFLGVVIAVASWALLYRVLFVKLRIL